MYHTLTKIMKSALVWKETLWAHICCKRQKYLLQTPQMFVANFPQRAGELFPTGNTTFSATKNPQYITFKVYWDRNIPATFISCQSLLLKRVPVLSPRAPSAGIRVCVKSSTFIYLQYQENSVWPCSKILSSRKHTTCVAPNIECTQGDDWHLCDIVALHYWLRLKS